MDQFSGMSPYLDEFEKQKQGNPAPNTTDPDIEIRKQKAALYQQAAGLAMAGGKSELGNGLLRMADHIYKEPSVSSSSDIGLYAKHIDMPGPTGKVHRFLFDPSTKGYTRDIGPIPAETFKAKNIIGRGGISKRPVFQDSSTGALLYADDMSAVPADDSTVLRPATARGLEAQQVSDLAGLKNTYDRLEDVSKRAEKMPEKFGPVSGRWEALRLKFVNDGDTQYALNEIKSMITIAYNLSGKQISEREMTMLQEAMLPQLNQPYQNFQSTLDFAKNWVAKTHDDRVDYFEKNYYDTNTKKLLQYENKPKENDNAQKTRTIVRTGKTKDGRKVIQFSDGSIEYAQ